MRSPVRNRPLSDSVNRLQVGYNHGCTTLSSHRPTHSATYRQSSRISVDAATWDPLNQWLARGPRFRVHAEVIRDLALTASGLLTRRIGGPSFFPPRPDLGKMIAYSSASWNVSQGSDRYRRGLYIHR